jgi:hypothetical protein
MGHLAVSAAEAVETQKTRLHRRENVKGAKQKRQKMTMKMHMDPEPRKSDCASRAAEASLGTMKKMHKDLGPRKSGSALQAAAAKAALGTATEGNRDRTLQMPAFA